MDIILGLSSAIVLVIAVFFGLTTILNMGKVLININKYDELERKVVYETFAVSFCIIVILHLIQLISSFTKFDLSYLISVGGFRTGGLISNSPLHIDSFIFDMIVLGITYQVKKKKFGMKWLIATLMKPSSLDGFFFCLFSSYPQLLIFLRSF